MVVVHVEWLGEQTVRVQSQGTSVQVTFDAGLSIHQVAGACRELGDIGWEALGQWCTLMKGHTSMLANQDHQQSMMGLVTPDHILRWVSPQIHELLGWPVDEVLNHDVRELEPSEEVEVADALAFHFDERAENSAPLIARTKSGDQAPFLATMWPIYAPTHELYCTLGEFRPIYA